MVLIDGAGHFCAFTHPDRFLAALLESLPAVRLRA
jgi:pimeloyl-ACP methyl ester carboxylesterase